MKRILFIMTGGTIVSVDNGSGLEPATDNFFEPILAPFDCAVQFENPFNLDSSQVSPVHWRQIACLIDREKENIDGVVIAHGTDTMAYTAAGLSFLLENLPFPVVLTGSQIPLSVPDSDGRGNVELAIRGAMSRLKGVFVAFDGRIMSGNCCSKTYSDDKIGFESLNAPYVNLETVMQQQGAYRLNLDYTEDVFLLMLAPGIKGEILPLLLHNGYRKIVIEAYGKGGVPAEFLPFIQDGIAHGARIGITTQCTYGGADCYVYKTGRSLLDVGVLDYKKHTTEYAVADMMFRK